MIQWKLQDKVVIGKDNNDELVSRLDCFCLWHLVSRLDIGINSSFSSGVKLVCTSLFKSLFTVRFTSKFASDYTSGFTLGFMSGFKSGFKSGFTSDFTSGFTSGFTSSFTSELEAVFTFLLIINDAINWKALYM